MDRPSSILLILMKVLPALLALAVLPAWAVDSIRVVGLFSGTAVLDLDGRQRLLRAGQTSPEGVKLISANAQEAVLEVNGRRATYALGSHISSKYNDAAGRQIAVRIWPDARGMYTVVLAPVSTRNLTGKPLMLPTTVYMPRASGQIRTAI